MRISVIIPVGFKEEQLKHLLGSLKDLPTDSEVLLVTSNEDNLKEIEAFEKGPMLRKIISPRGRGLSMNQGALESKGEFLWFLHADSKLDTNTIKSLVRAMEENPDDLLYFRLGFYDGPKLMKLNEWGVRFRTHFLSTPFGDQGLCIKKDIFKKIGMYPTDVLCGEDHLLVRKAKRENISLREIKTKLYTSGRKYEKNGWIKTTMTHLYLWKRQAFKDYRQHRRI